MQVENSASTIAIRITREPAGNSLQGRWQLRVPFHVARAIMNGNATPGISSGGETHFHLEPEGADCLEIILRRDRAAESKMKSYDHPNEKSCRH
jgi:hypothetical protein